MTQPNENKTVTILAEHQFTDAEIRQIAVKMASVAAEYTRTEAQFSSVKQEFKSKLDRLELDRDDLTAQIRNGFEMRPTQAVVHFNDPTPGRKTFYFADKAALEYGLVPIREEAMDATDFQRDLPLDVSEEEMHRDADEGEAAIEEGELLNPERFPETGDSAAEVREAREVIVDAAQPIGTSVGAALDQAAVKTEAPLLLLDLSKTDWQFSGLLSAFKKAAKTAGWTAPQISLLAEELKKTAGVNEMTETLRPFVIAEPTVQASVDPELVQAGNFDVIRLSADLPDGFPLEKVTGMFRIAAVRAEWPAEAINTVVGEAERQARVIGDEPEATEQATRYLRSFCVSK